MSFPGFDAVGGATVPGAVWPGEPIPAVTPPVFIYPAVWAVEWAEAETQVTVTPAGPLAATVTVTGTGNAAGTLQPPDNEVIYPASGAVIQPSA